MRREELMVTGNLEPVVLSQLCQRENQQILEWAD